MNKAFLYILGILVLLLAACNNASEKQLASAKDEPLVKEIKKEGDSLVENNSAPENENEGKAAAAEEEKSVAAKKEPVKEIIETPKKPAPAKVRKRAKIDFSQTTYDFGEISEGDKITHSFTFKNTGNGPLTIDDVSVSCGCTVPSYPIMPIAPGETGKIGVVFDSKGKFGSQRPFITVKTNTKEKLTKLFLSGSIKHVFENSTQKDSSKISEKSNQ